MPRVPRRGADDMVAEVLDRVRGLERRLSTGEEEAEDDLLREQWWPKRTHREIRALMARLAPGTQVEHETYGYGVVERIEGQGDPRVVIDFRKEIGRKRLFLSTAQLKLVHKDEPPF
jgi:hypothetical protein